ISTVAPTFMLAVAGSVVAGPALGWLVLGLMDRVQHVPTAIILQFVSTFGVWMLADRVGLSGVLTMVCFAISVARTAPERTPPRPMLRPTIGSGLIISWAGMRGILSLAAAMALPPVFPYRDLIVLTAFSVVVGTLLIQGLTLKPLLRALDLYDDDPVGRELSA